jgi:hypothetical protein
VPVSGGGRAALSASAARLGKRWETGLRNLAAPGATLNSPRRCLSIADRVGRHRDSIDAALVRAGIADLRAVASAHVADTDEHPLTCAECGREPREERRGVRCRLCGEVHRA